MPISSPFGFTSTALNVISGHDLTGRVALVTGASSGIGVETARALLSAGARVYLAVRDPAKGEAVAADLRTRTGNPEASVLPLDLGVLASVREAAATVLAREPKLHILINNAGIMATPFGHTRDGFELQFGTNHLGHFLLTTLLIPALRAAAPARVVALSSAAHQLSDVQFEDLNYERRPYQRWEAYGQSKTADALFAVGLTRRLAPQGVTANAVSPGAIMTGLQQFVPEEERRALGWVDEHGHLNATFKTTEQGAATSIWAAVGPELDGVGGLYLADCQEAPVWTPGQPMVGYKPYARDPEHAERLWGVSEQWVKR